MRSSRSIAAAAALAVPLLLAAPAAASEVEARVVFSFADGDIDESSGLVDGGQVMFTVNDSGDDPVVYTVDKASGETTAATEYSVDDVEDVEGLAPGRGDVVWAGDIGDNNGSRASVAIYRVVSGSGDQRAPRYTLVYPDSPRNAETLLAHPGTGRLYIVSKAVTGGTVYSVPRSLDESADNEMSAVARVPGLVTDGAFFPDGKHVLVRSYASATVYTFPDFRRVGTVALPSQEQGEAVAIDGRGRIYLSSEGENSDVLQITLPADLRDALRNGSAVSAGPPQTVAPPPTTTRGSTSADGSTDESWIWIAAGIAAVLAAGWVLFIASRPGSRRRR